MKKFITLLCLLGSFSAISQVTVSGATTTSANTTYNVGTAETVQVFDADPGTTLYSDIPYNPPMPYNYNIHRIYRKQGVWKLDKVMVNASTGVTIPLLHSIASNTNTPPCNWGNGLILTGACDDGSVRAATITPTYVSIPQLTDTAISAIATPQKGMLVFDITNNCLKL